MIIWLSSYHKSGNTWVRTFLTNYLYEEKDDPFENINKIPSYPRERHFTFLNEQELKTLGDKENSFKHYIKSQEKINSNGGLSLFKTHSYCGGVNNNYFTNSQNTAGFIYFVRDPRSVAISLSHHMTKSLEDVVNIMTDQKTFMKVNDEFSEYLSSWRINYLSWRNAKYPKLIIKYEDLKDNSYDNFKKILKFINNHVNIEINDEKIRKIIAKCEFKNLQSFEKKNGFKERKGKQLFFRQGKVDEWKERLPQNLVDKLEKEFNSEMKELGYL